EIFQTGFPGCLLFDRYHHHIISACVHVNGPGRKAVPPARIYENVYHAGGRDTCCDSCTSDYFLFHERKFHRGEQEPPKQVFGENLRAINKDLYEMEKNYHRSEYPGSSDQHSLADEPG